MHPPNQSTWAMVLIGFVGIGFMTCRGLRGGLSVLTCGLVHICDANAGLLNNEPDIPPSGRAPSKVV